MASMHGHEFSPPSEIKNNIPRRHTLERSPFSTPLPRRNTLYAESILPTLSEPRIGRPLSDQLLRGSELVVRFQEPESDTMSEDGRSVADSVATLSTVNCRKSKRRSIRTSTAFQLAHPAPTLTQKQRLLQIRPKLLFQLQRLSTDARPLPSIDVVPSTVVVPRLIKKFPRMFRGKGELGANDVMLLRSEEYNTNDMHNLDEPDSDEEGLANRELVAVICALNKCNGGSSGKAEIVLSDGSVWEATPMTNTLYEFVHTAVDGTQTTARWVKKSATRKSVDFVEAAITASNNDDFRFTFSIINPNTRRHPVMASLTPNKLDIPDTYVSVSSSSATCPPTLSIRHFPDDSEPTADEEPTIERTTHILDEGLRNLIQVTAVWVALRRGLSPYFKYSDPLASSATPSTNSLRGCGRQRSLSLTPETLHTSSTMSYANTPDSKTSLGTLGSKLRRTSVKRSPASGASSPIERDSAPKRSVSTGSAFMQRAAAKKINGNTHSTVVSDSEGENSFGLPKRAATDGFVSTKPSFSSHNGPLSSPGSTTSSPQNTPTKARRQVQSAYIPTSALQHSYTNGQLERHSMDVGEAKQAATAAAPKSKPGKWKSFTNIFKRSRKQAA
jgi:hypothetical protein